MATWYCRDDAPTSTIGWSAVTPWASLTVYAAGVLRRQLATPTVGNERVFVCIIAGTSLASEPSWTVTKGAKTAEAAGPTWQELTGQPGPNGDFTNCPTWLAVKNTAPGLGRVIQNNAGTHLFIVSTAGTAGNGAEPSFGTTAGNTTADNTVTWTCIGAVGSFSAWTAPHSRLRNAFASTWGAAGDSFYLGDDHSETQSTSLTLSCPGTNTNPCFVYSIDHTASHPTTTLLAGATITTTGASTLVISTTGTNSATYYYGLTFSGASGGVTNGVTFAQTANEMVRFDACLIKKASTGAGSIGSGNNGSGASAILSNTQLQFGAAGDVFTVGGSLTWRETATAVAGGTLPTTLFSPTTAGSQVICEAVDFSALGSGKTLIGAGTSTSLKYYFSGCTIDPAATISTPTAQGSTIYLVSSINSAAPYDAKAYSYFGTQSTETTIIRTGGASDSTTGISFKVVTTANSKWVLPFECIPIPEWNTTVGFDRTATLHGIWNAAALPNNDDIWFDVQYLGASGSPISSVATSTKASNLAAAAPLTADSASAWDSLATARANTHAYSLGDVILLASNPGRIFFCTTAGTSAGSEPGGYASAVDGGSVTDNTAVFRAGVRFSIAVDMTTPQPQLEGYLRAYIRAAKVTSTWYIDPLLTLS